MLIFVAMAAEVSYSGSSSCHCWWLWWYSPSAERREEEEEGVGCGGIAPRLGGERIRFRFLHWGAEIRFEIEG